jgi:ribose 1,5-bisphosphokinase PhnN
MKVTIDRPWFNAQLLGRTEESMHFNAAKISTGKPQEVHDKLDKGETVNGANCLLPSWASAFIVVKDVHIVMSSASTFDASEISDM